MMWVIALSHSISGRHLGYYKDDETDPVPLTEAEQFTSQDGLANTIRHIQEAWTYTNAAEEALGDES